VVGKIQPEFDRFGSLGNERDEPTRILKRSRRQRRHSGGKKENLSRHQIKNPRALRAGGLVSLSIRPARQAVGSACAALPRCTPPPPGRSEARMSHRLASLRAAGVGVKVGCAGVAVGGPSQDRPPYCAAYSRGRTTPASGSSTVPWKRIVIFVSPA